MRTRSLLRFAALLALSLAAGSALACGKERWQVKVGTDRDAPQVALAPQDATIYDLASIVAPLNPGIRKDTRYAPTELKVFRIRATLTLIKREQDDDYHIVIEDNRGRTMIVEAADPSCAAGSAFEAQIRAVRAAIDAHFGGGITGKKKMRVPVTVTGVAFFDKMHGQEGVADNGIELHPLLSISFD